ncbi:MAG: 50S ribosomal protein L9 [Candidatus Jorgensenbacteria bacterium GW2011_GWA1_48_11]|uniref:Large ribosomal subunit protein bL9 n=1 Tax=Candidatus Jorgensenbacteria bacterium GW2011_GWA1_48_11 TaxID=1618660 RepID=A0A0G1UB89_9BACT|nr:MAG: 50S ribosomal protein L9 [Candidatus Jorgensenbacteria bacterium GW2011_GWA1_48_11]KKW11930.1 MAG: 50S ribosomal protein L9 [Candidatus Jorgensenbacteria bacterium GW2011_GWB1_49_9]
MKVILLAEVRGLGRKNDVKDVADGYFRNVLLPKKLAGAATPAALAELERRRVKAAEEKNKLIAELRQRIPEIKKLALVFKVKTGEKDEVFGSVTKKDVEALLSEKGFKNTAVVLAHHLKTLGEHEIEVDLGEGVLAKVRVLLEKDE